MRKVIVFSSRNASVREVAASTLTFSYNLPESLKFPEPYVARLLATLPRPQNIVFVQPDFVELQLVNGEREPFLGTSGAAAESSWVALATTEIPAIGLIKIRTYNAHAIGVNANFTLIVEFAPRRLTDLSFLLPTAAGVAYGT